MHPGQVSLTPITRRNRQIRRMRRVEELGHTLVGEGIGLILGRDEAPSGILRLEPRCDRGFALFVETAKGVRILSHEWVFADDFENLEMKLVVIIEEALKANQAPARPDFVGALGAGASGSPGQYQIHLGSDFVVAEQRRDRAVAALFLFGTQALVLESLGAVYLHDCDGTSAAGPMTVGETRPVDPRSRKRDHGYRETISLIPSTNASSRSLRPPGLITY